MLYENGLDRVVCREFNIKTGEPDLTAWKEMVARIKGREKVVKVGIVGKYVRLHDAYLSIVESLYHASFEANVKVDISWVDSEDITDETASSLLGHLDGILVPGGFGDRGIEGKITACKFARENNVPYFGICLGMQIAVIEFARNVCNIEKAHSREFLSDGKNLVIDLMPDQQGNIPKGGTMRLGSYPCKIKENSVMYKAYKQENIKERHRHRYEFNNDFKQELEDCGLFVSGTSPDGKIVETVEIPLNDFFVGVQFHPEFKSRPNKAHPLFLEFIKSTIK
jgi:CTP synthase